jgi:hypothetical protein
MSATIRKSGCKRKIPNNLTLPTYSPRYAPAIAWDSKNLRAAVDKKKGVCGDSSAFWGGLDIFPLVVGHESERRKWKRLRDTESDFQQQ